MLLLLLFLLFVPCQCYYFSSTLLLLLLFVVHWWCYSSYSLLFINTTNPLIPCSLLMMLFLLNTAPHQHCCSCFKYLFIIDVVATPFWHYFCSSCFRLVLPPSCFCKCGSNFPNSTSSGQTWRWSFFPQMFVDWWFFSKHYPFIFWVILIEVFLFCVQELFGHCTFNFTHCISFAHLHCVFF